MRGRRHKFQEFLNCTFQSHDTLMQYYEPIVKNATCLLDGCPENPYVASYFIILDIYTWKINFPKNLYQNFNVTKLKDKPVNVHFGGSPNGHNNIFMGYGKQP